MIFEPNHIPAYAVAATLLIASINFLTHNLNRTLNIKSHSYAEKLKLYREFIKLLSEIILLQWKGIRILEKGQEDEATQNLLLACAR